MPLPGGASLTTLHTNLYIFPTASAAAAGQKCPWTRDQDATVAVGSRWEYPWGCSSTTTMTSMGSSPTSSAPSMATPPPSGSYPSSSNLTSISSRSTPTSSSTSRAVASSGQPDGVLSSFACPTAGVYPLNGNLYIADSKQKRRDYITLNENTWGGDLRNWQQGAGTIYMNRLDSFCNSIPADLNLNPGGRATYMNSYDGGSSDDLDLAERSHLNAIIGVKVGCSFTATKAWCSSMKSLLFSSCPGITNGVMVWGGGLVTDSCGYLAFTNGVQADEDDPLKDMVSEEGWVRYVHLRLRVYS